MNTNNRVSELASNWLSYQNELLGNDTQDERNVIMDKYMPVIEAVDAAINSEPQLCWHFILEVLSQTESPQIMACLAAGPLEDLLVKHGSECIDDIEITAKQNKKLCELLDGVWQNVMETSVWERIQRLRLPPLH